MITITCQSCGKKLKVPEDKIGRQGNCPGCGNTMTLSIINETEPNQPVGTERRLRKLERQNRFLCGALVVVLIIACAGPFIRGSEPVVESAVVVAEPVLEKLDVPAEPVEAKPIPRKAVEKFDILVANSLRASLLIHNFVGARRLSIR